MIKLCGCLLVALTMVPAAFAAPITVPCAGTVESARPSGAQDANGVAWAGGICGGSATIANSNGQVFNPTVLNFVVDQVVVGETHFGLFQVGETQAWIGDLTNPASLTNIQLAGEFGLALSMIGDKPLYRGGDLGTYLGNDFLGLSTVFVLPGGGTFGDYDLPGNLGPIGLSGVMSADGVLFSVFRAGNNVPRQDGYFNRLTSTFTVTASAVTAFCGSQAQFAPTFACTSDWQMDFGSFRFEERQGEDIPMGDVPEPSTIALLGAGLAYILRRSRS